jgi:hypothetical protein
MGEIVTKSSSTTSMSRWRAVAISVALVIGGALISTGPVAASEPGDMVLQWNVIALAAIGNANGATPPGLNQPPPLAPIHLAMVQTAVYDAVNAITGTHEPYLGGLQAPPAASQAAAAATAAHDVLVGLVPTGTLSQVTASLDEKYTQSMATITDSQSKSDGAAIGAAAAAAMLQARAGDGRFGSRTFVVGTQPGEWRPVAPLSNNVFAWISDVRPFALATASQFVTEGPPDLASAQYAAELNEAKLLGGTSSTRTADQALLAAFVSTNPVGPISRALREIATARGLSAQDQARLLAQTNMSAADAAIDCWYNKVHWSFWRPQTAIQLADTDGNDATTADPEWTSLVATPGYTDNPSGYNCISAAMMNGARAFFGTDRVSFTLNNPASNPPTVRNYDRFTDFVDDAVDGRVLIGLHFRSADEQGAWVGRKVAQLVSKQYFGSVD